MVLVRDFLLLVSVFVGLSSGQSCQSSTYNFFDAQQISDYVVYEENVPELNETTVCGAVEAPVLGSGSLAILSYAVDGDSNELLLIITANTFTVWARGTSKEFRTPINLRARQFHFCVSISTVTEEIALYISGKLFDTKGYSSGSLRPGGILLLGQDRDNNNIDGFHKFDSKQAFSGTLSNFYIWSRVLDTSEILNMAQECSCPDDHVISFESGRVQIYGDVTETPATCPTFFHCQSLLFQFPADDQVTDFVRYTGDFPEMSETSACVRLNSDDRNRHFVFSYAAGSVDNELSLAFSRTNGWVRIWHQGSVTEFAHSTNTQVHLCFTISIPHSEINLYVDGFYVGTEVISDERPFQPGGLFVVGQDQDAVSEESPAFVGSQAYIGDISDIIIWSRVLNASEIYQLATGCPCPADASVRLTSDNTQQFGNVTVSLPAGVCSNGERRYEYAQCGLTSFDFPVDDQITDYVQLNEAIPDFHELTYCAWNSPTTFRTRTRYHFSYSSFNRSNELLMGENGDDIRVTIKNSAYVFNIAKSMNATRHICITLSTFTDQLQVYVDGELSNSREYTGSKILGGGRLVLGNDQDEFSTATDLGLQKLNAWSGVIRNPTIWSRVLTPTEISDIANDCRCPTDPTIFFESANTQSFGAATSAVQETCTTVTGIEFCAPRPCHTYADCDPVEGGYNCTCDVGFDGDGTSCSDVDECLEGTHNCDVNAACVDTTGSFTCVCNAGFTQSGSSCTEIDECSDGIHNCSAVGGICTNVPGSFECSCSSGYTGDIYACTDINECTDGSLPCSSVAGVCTNTAGSFTCHCASGYSGDGFTCEDVNECTDGTANCDSDVGVCTNANGSFTCDCSPGYEGDGATCEDVNECAEGTANCDSDVGVCTNTNGSFSCGCSPGYNGDGATCEDIDECTDETASCSSVGGVCANTNGSFDCSCAPGYSGDGFTCEDVNECTDGSANCDSDIGVCTNSNGSFSCTCGSGYEGDGIICEDIDECLTNNGGCGDTTTTDCRNTNGSFQCSCRTGFSGNPCTSDETTTQASVSSSDTVVVHCSANEMRLSLPVAVVRQFSSQIQEMYLRNGSCPPTISADNTTYQFVISGNLADECDTQVERNDTHIIYKNEVASFFDPNQLIFTGAHFSIPFQCAFPAVGNIISINYTVVIVTATVLPPGGGGAFQLSSQLFTSNLFDTIESQRTFQTTDFLFVQIGIDTQDSSLTAVLHRCWATPTADLNDVTQYDFITESCPVPGVIDNTLQVQSNGESSQARFQVQAFAFTDDDQLYLHCEVAVCDLDTEICVPDCSGSRKRRGLLPLAHRLKRQAVDDVEYQTIGPIYRVVPEPTGTTSNAVLIGGVLGGVVVALVAVLVLIAIKIHAAGVVGGGIGASAAKEAALSGLSNMKGVDNPAMMT